MRLPSSWLRVEPSVSVDGGLEPLSFMLDKYSEGAGEPFLMAGMYLFLQVILRLKWRCTLPFPCGFRWGEEDFF